MAKFLKVTRKVDKHGGDLIEIPYEQTKVVDRSNGKEVYFNTEYINLDNVIIIKSTKFVNVYEFIFRGTDHSIFYIINDDQIKVLCE